MIFCVIDTGIPITGYMIICIKKEVIKPITVLAILSISDSFFDWVMLK